MKSNKLATVFAAILFSLNCTAQFTGNAKNFLEDVKNGDYAKAKSLFCRDLCITDPEGIDYQLHDAHDVMMEYGIPDEKTWNVKYDTVKGPAKVVHYIVPLYKTDKPVAAGVLEYAFADLVYDYSRKYTGDSLFNFTLRIRYKH